MIMTYDLNRLGACELLMASELLAAYSKGVPDNWEDDGVRLAFNTLSGYVFLVNSNGEMLMKRDDRVARWYSLPESNLEGFMDDLYAEFEGGYVDPEDYGALADYLRQEGMAEEAARVKEAMGA